MSENSEKLADPEGMSFILVDSEKFLIALDKSIELARVDIPEDDKDYWQGYYNALVHVKELFQKAGEHRG